MRTFLPSVLLVALLVPLSGAALASVDHQSLIKGPINDGPAATKQCLACHEDALPVRAVVEQAAAGSEVDVENRVEERALHGSGLGDLVPHRLYRDMDDDRASVGGQGCVGHGSRVEGMGQALSLRLSSSCFKPTKASVHGCM